ncbi:MAG TPA: hypothetical protein VEF04_07295, partial [Blastocatellia bacterium]|nr:hypothetical protein [Blastocatellia bacterium]
EVAQFSAEGADALGVNETEEPKSIVTAIGNYVSEQRVNVQQAAEDDYAWLILSMAYLWGNQVCRAYKWEWVKLVYDGGESKAIVSPNRAFAVYPLPFIKELVDDPERESTIVLLFNMLEGQFLESQFPQGKAGKYMTLG